MSDSDNVCETLGIESREDLNAVWNTPETSQLDAQVHEAARAEHPEWFEKN